MKKTAVLTVVAIKEGSDKNGRKYRNVVVETPSVATVNSDFGLIPVKVKPRRSSFNAWEESYVVEGQTVFGYDVAVGDTLAGTIVRRKVKTAIRDENGDVVRYANSYTIKNDGRPDTVTDEYSTVVFGDSADEEAFETAVRLAFRREDHPLVEDPIVKGIAVLAEPRTVAA